jgi:hypothetical protein
MFSKLLKHEWKANANTLGILSLAALGLGIFATIAMRLILYVGPQIEDETRGLALLIVGLSMMLFFSFMALMIYVVAVQFILLFRFYKSRFTDEGYLTFTLPVTSHQIFLSSWAIMLLWMAISVVIVLTSITMFIFIGTATEGLINQDAAGELPNVWRAFTELYQILYGDNAATSVIFGLSAFVSILCSPLLIMTCITLGAVVAKKHKILAAFGIYYGLNVVIEIIGGVLSFVALMFDAVLTGEITSMQGSLIATMMLQIGLSVGGYFLSTHLMKNKLNLP